MILRVFFVLGGFCHHVLEQKKILQTLTLRVVSGSERGIVGTLANQKQ